MNEMLARRYKNLLDRAAELSDLESAAALLGWDQETMMPGEGVDGRASVLATLAGIQHEKATAPSLAEDVTLLEAEENGLGELERAQVQEMSRKLRRLSRIPAALVKAVAETQSKATAVWAQARADKNFAAFAPYLEEMIRLKRETAEAVGYEDEPYDALLDEYEPDAKTRDVAAVLSEVRGFLVPLVARIADCPAPDAAIVAGPFDHATQDVFGRELIEAMGFRLDSGRLDVSQHPFTSGIHAGDTRLTTRYKDDLTVGLFGTLHETGHGLYEQNLGSGYRRTPVGTSVSLGIHESQSRLWENIVGRGRSFWSHFFPRVQALFPKQLGGRSVDEFYRAVNLVKPSYIRIDADEVTYNLHIALRFELEREMLSGRIQVRDLPEAWNLKFQEYLGLNPPSPDMGVLQDIHWAAGYIGYFPTYTLGNVYASQIYAAALRDIPDLEARIARGDLLVLRDWLVEKIHRHSRRYAAAELLELATGKAPATDDFKAYLRDKFGKLYGL